MPGAVVPELAFHLRLSRLYGRGVNELIRDREVTEEFAIQFRAAIARLTAITRNWSEPSRSINNFVKITSNLNDCAVLH
jgi:hypothetical protein